MKISILENQFEYSEAATRATEKLILYVCVSRGKKCYFWGKCWTRTK